MNTNMQMRVKLISPIEAQELVDAHVNYRKKSPKRISAYASLMEKGMWHYSILIFDEDGFLLDGQNRLHAIIKSGLPQHFAIITGWPKHMRIGLDNNQPRSGAQVLAAERPNSKERNKVLAACVGIDNITREGGKVVLNVEKIELYDKHGDLVTEVMQALPRALKAGLHATPFCKAIICHPSRKEDIMSAVHKLAELDFSEPRMNGLKLYFNWAVVRGFSKGGSNVRKEAYLRCARAIKAYLDGESLDKLYCPTKDPFEAN